MADETFTALQCAGSASRHHIIRTANHITES